MSAGEACLCQLLTDNFIASIQFCTKMHYACQKRHVCLGSKPCLSCVVTSKTAAIHFRCQHSMCNFLSCKILQGPHPTAWDRKAFLLAFLMPILEYKRTPYTFYHAPSCAPSKQMYHPFTCHACTFQQPSLVPMQTIFLEQDYITYLCTIPSLTVSHKPFLAGCVCK